MPPATFESLRLPWPPAQAEQQWGIWPQCCHLWDGLCQAWLRGLGAAFPAGPCLVGCS